MKLILHPWPREGTTGSKGQRITFPLQTSEWFTAILLAIFELGDIDLVVHPQTLVH